MPIHIELANLILDKEAVAWKYTGGVAQFIGKTTITLRATDTPA